MGLASGGGRGGSLVGFFVKFVVLPCPNDGGEILFSNRNQLMDIKGFPLGRESTHVLQIGDLREVGAKVVNEISFEVFLSTGPPIIQDVLVHDGFQLGSEHFGGHGLGRECFWNFWLRRIRSEGVRTVL